MRSLLSAGLVVLAGCGSHLPAPECDANPAFSGSPLTCDAAVAVALIGLTTDHPAIERVQFLYGSATPHTRPPFPEEDEQPVDAYVVFTYSDGSDRRYVPVVWWRDALTAGTPAAY